MKLDRNHQRTVLSAIALVMLGGLCMPFAGAAAPDVSATVNVGAASQAGAATAPIQASVSQDLLLNVNNTTGGPVSLDVPDLGIHYDIAANSGQTYFFNLAKFPSASVPFTVKDGSGATLTSSQITLTDYQAKTDTSSLDSIINYSTAYNAEVKPEPVYYNTKTDHAKGQSALAPTEAKPKRHYVRGYW